MADNYKQLTGLTQGTEYEFRIVAIGDGTTYANSEYSTIQEFTTLIKLATPAPSLAKTTDSVTATWSAITNATSYTVAYKTGSGDFTETTTSATTFTLDNLAEDTTVVIKVKATSSQTTVYEESDYSSEVTETTQTTLATPAPTLSRTTSTITATWAAIANATGYVVSYKTGTDAFTEANVVNPTFTLDSLAEGVTYVIKVKAVTTNTSYADSGYSAEGTATTQITLGTPTQTLTKTTNSITATWSAIPNATGYTVAYKTGNGDFTEVTTSDPTYTLSGLNEDVTYTIKVKATSTNDNYVESSYSSESSETTLITLATPSGVGVTDVTTNSARIVWNNVTNATGYRIEYRRVGDTEWTEVTD